MSYYENLVISLFFAISPVIVGAIRFSKINPVFYPFLVSLWLSAFNLTFGYLIVHFGYYNIVHYNIWFLLDAFVLLWCFKIWNLFERAVKLYRALQVLFGLFWMAETLIFTKLTLTYNSYFRIFYSFIIVLMSINTINYILIRERKSLLKNSVFVICCCFVLSNTITVLAEAFFASNLQLGDIFRLNMDRIITYATLLCNLIYVIAILWMPKKQAFMLQY